MKKFAVSNEIFICKDKLTGNEQDDLELIYEYFNGFDIEYYSNDKYYVLSLTMSDFAYCEDLTVGLNDIGVSQEELNDYCLTTKNACLCLSENWIPYAWSCLTHNCKKILQREKIAIIHVDDHSDLMSPFIGYDNGQYINMLNRNNIDFFDAKSMYDAVKSGAITIGSMLTAIVYVLPTANVYHVKQNVEERVYGMKRECVSDSFFTHVDKRIKISLSENNQAGNGYILTSSWDSVSQYLSDEDECLLHIDMDYFNNRFNGSTSWKTDNRNHDPAFTSQMQCMDQLCSSVKMINQRIPIKHILIGISPSFYPAEYWKIGLRYLLKGLEKSGIDIQSLISETGGLR